MIRLRNLVALVLVGCVAATVPPIARSQSAPVRLSDRPTTVRVQACTPAAGQSAYLVFRDGQATTAPGILYQIYLGAQDDAHHVAPYSFFNTVGTARSSSFDVTQLLRRAVAEGRPLDVIIVPSGTPAPGSEPRIGEIRIACQ
jgi:hypothetical protein